MKKLLIICILIVSLVFISGCTNDKQVSSEISTSSQSNHKSDGETSNLILKLSDLPQGSEIYRESVIYGAMKTEFCSINTNGRINCSTRNYPYNESIPPEYKVAGGRLIYQHKSWGRFYGVEYYIFDTSDGIKEYIMQQKEDYQKGFDNIKEENPNFIPPEISDNQKIGDYSLAIDIWENPHDDDLATVIFQKNNKLVTVWVNEEKEFALNDALKIARIIEKRLD